MSSATDRIQGTDLERLLGRPAPFVTLFLTAGRDRIARARIELDKVGAGHPHNDAILTAIEEAGDELDSSTILVATGDGSVTSFAVDATFVTSLARTGSVPTIGPLLEAARSAAPHAVITVDDDVYAITSFLRYAASDDDTDIEVVEALDAVIDLLDERSIGTVGLVGDSDAIDDARSHLVAARPGLRLLTYPTTDIDGDLTEIADRVVVDITSAGAEALTNDIAQMRAARDTGRLVEGRATLTAIEDGLTTKVFVHDDLDDVTDPGVDRLADLAIAAAVRAGVPVVMLPALPPEREPSDGVAALVGGEGDGADGAAAELAHAGAVGRPIPASTDDGVVRTLERPQA